MRKRPRGLAPPLETVAGNGLLHRRALLGGGAALAGAMTTGAALTRASAETLGGAMSAGAAATRAAADR